MSRQTERTRGAILTSFRNLVFNEKYQDISVSRIVAGANVGRSTFYLHFEDKEALLIESLGEILDLLALTCRVDIEKAALIGALDHIWQYRDKGRRIFAGVSGDRLEKALARKVAKVLRDNHADGGFAVAPIFVSNQMSASILSLLRTWLAAEASAKSADLARHLCASSAAIATNCGRMETGA